MKSNYLAKSLVATLAAFFALTSMVACSNSVEKIEQSSNDKVDADSAKASADAEAAEETFAKEKSGKAAKRGVASVKKHSKKAKDGADHVPSESVFVVQVGTFKSEENAKRITEKLKLAGLPVFQKKIERENGAVLYAVRFEPTPNRVEAEKFASTVKATTGESSLIMSFGN